MIAVSWAAMKHSATVPAWAWANALREPLLPSFTIEDSLSIGKLNHAPLVATLYSHSSRGSG